ncbi:MAG: MarR family winged helix-turn-helix transcriptional regulator [Bacteroidales bacterium]
MTPKLTAADYRALAEFRFLIRRFLGFSERAARVSGLEPRQHQLLLAIKGLPEDAEPTIGELARRLQVEHHSAVEMVDRLEERRLVARLRDERDRRRVLVGLTARGEALLRDLSLSHREELQAAAPALVSSLGSLLGAGRRKSPAAGTSNGRGRSTRKRTHDERPRRTRR